jgi:hypothetical protein
MKVTRRIVVLVVTFGNIRLEAICYAGSDAPNKNVKTPSSLPKAHGLRCDTETRQTLNTYDYFDTADNADHENQIHARPDPTSRSADRRTSYRSR